MNVLLIVRPNEKSLIHTHTNKIKHLAVSIIKFHCQKTKGETLETPQVRYVTAR